ncbi:Calcineurin-like phosphoesterase [Halogranum amylolyticum]|uniref:Calcineurin-like phosphoesterase n=1 Tax=Halogranum amylolyticum TaxID=660520 RepID=A0A1H8USC5_9EURY|nr:metallophosphoesterase [Halogranum amylolyticum]SEP06071.1 Calcineurin-like phosphoesterase [Halogranum amylolyticum]
MATQYYFISDLHIGGDEHLCQCDFEDELIEFLARLEQEGGDTELIVSGDIFGLWELTEVDGPDKLAYLTEQFPALFEQFRATGERIHITFIPGNHDYELACYPEFVDFLVDYNVDLQQELHLERAVGDDTIWIEHGMQHDSNNRMPNFGDPHANPLGYFVNRHVTSTAGRLSGRGRYSWLKDIQSVAPMEEIPRWIFSKYFYREMSPLLRYAIVPFLLLFNFSVLYTLVLVARQLGIFQPPVLDDVLSRFGIIGDVVGTVIAVNVAIVVLLTVISVPLYLFTRDGRRVAERFGLLQEVGRREAVVPYLNAASEVFAADSSTTVFVYGHTHRVSLTELDGRYVVNTGTWLKRLSRVEPPVTLLPSVYYPSYRLSYFRIFAEDGHTIIEYDEVSKEATPELTLLERLFTARQKPREEIPRRTVVDRPASSLSTANPESKAD